ncbi:MAG: NADP-dependent isocitrate dehydrogenase, partial [Candidatus Thorarchaeota archaeon]
MNGESISFESGQMIVPNTPIIPFIEGDGIGPDIMRTALRVWDHAVKKAYDDSRKVAWLEIPAGSKSYEKHKDALPQKTLDAIVDHKIAIKGPLTTPVGLGFRSLNVKIRKELDLYAGVRPSHHFPGVPSPVREPEKLDVVIFRENTEDVYSGIEWEMGSPGAKDIIDYIQKKHGYRIRPDSGIGVKPISEFGTKRLVRKAIEYAIENNKPSVTLAHKGNIMKFTEGAFRNWGYELALEEFREHVITEDELWDQVRDADGVTPVQKKEHYAELRNGGDPGNSGERIVIKDRICDQMFQQVLLRPAEYSVIAAPNLNGDYLSDACTAQVGGLGLAPGANFGDEVAVFEPVHGTAPKYAGLDKVNPTGLILSGAMMFQHLGWSEVVGPIHDAI